MKRMTRVLVAAVMGTLLLAAGGWAQSPTRYILRADSSQQTAICQTYGLSFVQQLATPQAIVVTGPESVAPDDLVAQVRADARVTAFERVRKALLVEAGVLAQQTAPTGSASAALSNPNYQNFFGNPVWVSYVTQAALAQIEWGYSPAASRQSVGSNTPGYGAIVAVIDTGVDPSHPALQGVLLPGYDFLNNQPVGSEWTDVDQSTAAILNQSTAAILNQSTVAILNGYQVVQLNQSTAAILDQSTAAILNGITLPAEFGHGTMVAGLVHLVAPGAQIMPLKAFAADGSANSSDIVSAIYYAVANGATVINMSFSLQDLSSELLLAVDYATRHGVVCVDLLTLVAPGEGLITTYPGGHWAGVSGTSSSAALTSATVAIGLGKENQRLTNPGTFSDLDDAMDAIASVNAYDPTLGWGVLDVAKMSKIRHSGNRTHPH